MGIEPTCSAWKADVLPLNYTRSIKTRNFNPGSYKVVEGRGFEPLKLKTADLQSAPVGRLGIPPTSKARHFRRIHTESQYKKSVISPPLTTSFQVSKKAANYRHLYVKNNLFFKQFFY